MKKKLYIPPETIDAQTRAADPAASVWVSANAGSGKTHVLTERVIRLLLEGTDPSKILCLTYTKAAAAVMQNRVFARLSEWAVLPDSELAERLKSLEGRRPGAPRLAVARRLFARALETPGGLKIQTIHAFCEAILHQFPLEANIAGHFEMMDDLMQVALVGEARRQLLETAHGGGNANIAAAFADVLQASGEMGLQSLLDEAVNRRNGLQRYIAELGVAETRAKTLHRAFGFDRDERESDILAELWPVPEFSDDALDLILSIQKGAARAHDFALQLKRYDKVSVTRDREAVLRAAFLKSTGEPKSGSYVGSAAVKKLLPDFEEAFDAAASRVEMGLDRLKELRLVRLNLAALTLIDDLLQRYHDLKRKRGLLDFEDLITRTVALLARDGAGQWVQYKLDRGIDHILVDEAQDTSPDQWQVIRMLSEEFFSGLGQRNLQRTLFAVGDEKQSIYSFQGAVPEDFAAQGRSVSLRAGDAELKFERVSLNFSFRSAPDVLQAVDEVFARPEANRGLAGATVHDAIRADAPGEVEIWDMLTPEAVEEPDDWRVPVDHLAAPAVRLAEQIAATIRYWLDRGEPIPGQNRRIVPRDIMVLVRKRDQFMPALSRALKNLGVPVAGADRLRLTSHIAIQDLMALGRFVLQPSDDLSLASLLKSPLFGWDDDRLFALAHPRGSGSTLFEHLYRASRDDEALAAIHKTLSRWRGIADTMPVFEFYARILSADGARRKLLARLGPEAGDIIDEFQNYALSAERAGLPGLQAFLETLDAASPEIKRELDQGRNEVRLMTVHAAKGLEGAVVFLVDPGSAVWTGSRAPKLIPYDLAHDGPPVKGYLWQPNGSWQTGFTAARIEELKARAEEEYRRLLYVGMTRAEDRLIICGYRGTRESGETWHRLAEDALAIKSETFVHPVQGVAARRYRNTPRGLTEIIEPDQAEATPLPGLPPEYLLSVKPEAGLPRPLAPSGASALIEADEEPPLDASSPVLGDIVSDGTPGFALRRGTAIHMLLQYLPEVPESEREKLAEDYLGRIAGDWPEAERHNAVSSVKAILTDPQFAPVFASGSRGEVAIMGTINLGGRDHAVSGQVDRISVDATRVLVVDYKTNRPPPKTVEAVPFAYRAQLALYKALLEPLYPGRVVETALLFTEGPFLLPLSDAVLDEAMQALRDSQGKVSN
ncbi:double-strand break repair helicase AddA [Brucella sp. NM4]|uniref:double-strand break repair helicase AddA n=1 Tax=Brucella/Ochrobactrum group TaxID=2826938 RepID=UPI0024BD22EB|nr:double-strand break repair helicase AddA [Brucella sp. NM4]WHS32020.1 double-strand break repair helicase AddA [Brucella sp. NM4]WHT41498.1 double-strand break repair helicase AddA [Ochrobactrum sp. SSR]